MKKRKKLIWQLLPPYLLIIMLSLAGLVLYGFVTLDHFLLERTRQDLGIRLKLLEEPIGGFVEQSAFRELDAYCKKFGRAVATRITVILPSGKVVGDSFRDPGTMVNHSDRPEVIGALAGKISSRIRFSQTLGKRLMYVAEALKSSDGRQMAVLRVSVPVVFIQDELYRVQVKLALAGLLAAMLAGVVSLVVSRRINRPITEMKNGAQRFASGDLSHRLPLPAGEELAALAEALNQMAAELERRISTIVSQRNELDTIVSSMREGLIAVDRREMVVNVNQAAAGMLETVPEKIKNKALVEVTRNLELQNFVRRAIEQKTGSKAEEKDLEIRYKGEKRVVNARSMPLLEPGGFFSGTLVVLNDVTELRRLEAVRQDFVANVSHEIKTPLTAIKGFVEMLRYGRVESAAESQRFLEIIERHVNRLNTIVDDLLVLSRLERQGRPIEMDFQQVEVENILKTARQVCQAAAGEKQIRIEIDCPAGLVAVVDKTLLEQALINLVDNAVKYSGPGTRVVAGAGRDAKGVFMRVSDQGRGIDKKHLPRLFERFYRVDKARSRKLGGTGLGLSIVKHIVQAHGGYVEVESVPGRGSTFTIRLPGSREAAQGYPHLSK